jgi:hypothetical protein
MHVIPNGSEGPHLNSWITQANLSIQHRAREVPLTVCAVRDYTQRACLKALQLLLKSKNAANNSIRMVRAGLALNDEGIHKSE